MIAASAQVAVHPMPAVVVWEFTVQPDAREAFVAAYGPDGDWARLFRRDPAYLGTTLLADATDPARFVTVDRWERLEAFDAFHARHAADYEALDRRCASLTSAERLLGRFTDQP